MKPEMMFQRTRKMCEKLKGQEIIVFFTVRGGASHYQGKVVGITDRFIMIDRTVGIFRNRIRESYLFSEVFTGNIILYDMDNDEIVEGNEETELFSSVKGMIDVGEIERAYSEDNDESQQFSFAMAIQ